MIPMKIGHLEAGGLQSQEPGRQRGKHLGDPVMEPVEALVRDTAGLVVLRRLAVKIRLPAPKERLVWMFPLEVLTGFVQGVEGQNSP